MSKTLKNEEISQNAKKYVKMAKIKKKPEIAKFHQKRPKNKGVFL
jgi:hypothetical protein